MTPAIVRAAILENAASKSRRNPAESRYEK